MFEKKHNSEDQELLRALCTNAGPKMSISFPMIQQSEWSFSHWLDSIHTIRNLNSTLRGFSMNK